MGWANSSLRCLQELPTLPPDHVKARGIVLEDALLTSFHPVDARRLKAAAADQRSGRRLKAAAADQRSGRRLKEVAADQRSGQQGADARSGSAPVTAEPAAAADDFVSVNDQKAGSSSGRGAADTPSPVGVHPPGPSVAAAVPDTSRFDVSRTDAAPRAGSNGPDGGAAVPGVSSRGSSKPPLGAQLMEDIQQDLQRRSATVYEADLDAGSNDSPSPVVSTQKTDAGNLAAASSSQPAAPTSSIGGAVASSVSVSNAGSSADKTQYTALMLRRLQALPWRRVDMCFQVI